MNSGIYIHHCVRRLWKIGAEGGRFECNPWARAWYTPVVQALSGSWKSQVEHSSFRMQCMEMSFHPALAWRVPLLVSVSFTSEPLHVFSSMLTLCSRPGWVWVEQGSEKSCCWSFWKHPCHAANYPCWGHAGSLRFFWDQLLVENWAF